MKKWFSRISNIFLILFLVFLIYKRAPDFFNHIKSEGSVASPIKIEMLNGQTFDSDQIKNSFVVVFWATWCAPCEIELSRINKMILNNEIKAESILAISIEEEKSLVQSTAQKRDYKFQIALDVAGKISSQYKINGTPTIIFVDENKMINWMSTGLSPALGYRIVGFLNKK